MSREKTYKAMTQEDLDVWNANRISNMKKVRPNHWSVRHARRVRLVRICLEWREACQMWRRLAHERLEKISELCEQGKAQDRLLQEARKDIETLQRQSTSTKA